MKLKLMFWIMTVLLVLPIAINAQLNITLDFPANNSVVEIFDNTGETFDIDFQYTVNATTVTCNLFLNDTLEQTQSATSGSNTFSVAGFDVNQTVKYIVGCDFIGQPLNSTFHVFAVEITEVVQFFQASLCRTDTGAVLLLGLFLLIAFILITMGFATKIGFIGVLGSLVLLFSSLFIMTCATAVATILMFLSLLLMFSFIFRSFFPRSSGEGS